MRSLFWTKWSRSYCSDWWFESYRPGARWADLTHSKVVARLSSCYPLLDGPFSGEQVSDWMF